jgi:uncharacterized membrane protein YedE/YeeE
MINYGEIMFSSPEILASLIGAIITFVLGVLATYIAQVWVDFSTSDI